MPREPRRPPDGSGVVVLSTVMKRSSLAKLTRNSSVLGWIAQIAVLVFLFGLFAILASTAMENWNRTGSSFEWDWLHHQFATQLSEGYNTHPDTQAEALLVGIVNTFRVTIAAIITASIVGVAVGIGRLSENWIVRKASAGYVEVFRNIPVLLQMFFWEALIIYLAPIEADAIGRYLFKPTNKGIGFAWFRISWGFWALIAVGAIIVILVRRMGTKQRTTRVRVASILGAIVLAVVGWLILDAVSGPLLRFELASIVERGNFTQFGDTGMVMTESFFAVWFGLTIYAGSFIAEIVRGGILAVHRGQREAGQALGLNRLQSLRFVVLPQAMRVILPPLGNQYLNILKYSALGVAVAYPELMKVGGSIINATGQERAVVLIWVGFFLSFSLAISGVVNYYNRKVGLVGTPVHGMDTR